MHLPFLVSLLTVIGGDLVAARAVPNSHVVHERRHLPSTRWIKRDRVAPHVKVPVRIGLKQNQDVVSKAQDWLMDVSHPSSSNFGQHWTQAEVIEAFAPHEDSVATVKQWISSVLGEKPVTHSDNKAWLAFDATVSELEELVHAQFHEAHHEASGRAMISCDQYHVPKHITDHIDYITPGVKGVQVETAELRKRDKRSRKGTAGWKAPKWRPAPWVPGNQSDLANCDVAITPACIQALYDFKPLDPHAEVSKNNSMGIFEEGDFYSQLDLNLFFRNFTKYIPNGTHPILDSIDGGEAPVAAADAGGESDLDFQLAIPIIYPQTTTLYQTDDLYYAEGYSPNATGIFNTFLDGIDGSYCTYSAYGETGDDPSLDPSYPDPNGYKGQLMCGVYKPTNVISISYGEQEQDLPAYYQERQCNEFLKLGLQGVSIFVASGDTGVGGLPGDGTANGCLRNGTVFSPTQPNSCPWLTNVGATKVYPGHTVFEPESAANDPAGDPYNSAYSSGGGFSNIFPIPSYQSSAIATYFKDYDPPYPYYYDGQYNSSAGLYNRNGRGIPDVAANGDNIAIYLEREATLEGGTSAASPIFAALVTRINEERIKVGKGPVGFINPTLYSHPEVLNDIVNGTNPGCGTDGFSCTPGWDPVTGLGTPNYPKMLALFLSLP
ncbi:subtilisin-like protein [Teratosphaeria nubilosa]|uniref:Subtilisin-like protein n=1 Tax=Teratosphaeria nubilosa TaxID=161662 RepID=A0A6G1L6K4_9PEZI|nr:subtilisin-like protein [Teratosphaeria nubilosa]